MQIIVQRAILLGALKRASGAIVTGSALHTSCLFVEAVPELPVRISASDGILRISTQAEGEVKKPGVAVVAFKRLSDIVNQLPAGPIEITVNPKLQVSIRSLESKRKFTMQAHDPAAYPPVLKVTDGETLYRVESKIFLQATSEVEFIVDSGFADAILLARTENNDRHFQLVALSNYGMAVATAWFTEIPTARVEILIPSKLCDAAQNLEAGDQVLEIQADEHRVTLIAPGTTIACDRVSTSFPSAWREIIASMPTEKRFRCSAVKLLDCVRAVSVAAEFVEGQERFVQIDIKYRAPECWVSTKESVTNQGEDELAIQDPTGAPCTIHMDGMRLVAGLRAFGPADVNVFYDVAGAQEAFCLASDSLQVMLLPVRAVKAK